MKETQASWMKTLTTAIFFMISLAVFSQNDSLVSYMEIAAKNNPVILQKFAEYEAALQKIPQAGSLQDPQLSLGVFLMPMELLNGSQVADITLMQMFPWFGVLRNAKDEMSLMANARFEEFRESKLQVFFDVRKTFYELWKIREEKAISEQNLEILRSIEQIALIRYKSAPLGSQEGTAPGRSMSGGASGNSATGTSSGMKGMTGVQQGSSGTGNTQPQMKQGSMESSSQSGGLTDLYRIRIETGDLRNSIALLKNRETTVIARFNNLLNRSSWMAVFTPDSIKADTLAIPLSAVPDSIRERNPMLEMIEFERKSYESRSEMVKGMGKPMLGLGLNYSLIRSSEMAALPEMNGRDMIMPMVNITLPVYRKKYRAMQREAELRGEAALLNYEAIYNNLEAEYYEAVQMYIDAQRRMELYSEQYMLASKSLDIMVQGFSSGSNGLTDIFRIQQQTLDYSLMQVEALADFNTAAAWLRRLISKY